MQDSALFFVQRATTPFSIAVKEGFILENLHRAENTDNPVRLKAIIAALNELRSDCAPVVLLLHPLTRRVIEGLGLKLEVQMIDPVGYLEMIWLLRCADLVLTDSGGIQKEAFFFGKLCVTRRNGSN